MSSSSKKLSVLIVGAGPTGLTLAAILRRYEIDFRIVEKKSALSRYTKATNLMQRNQEILAALDLLKPLNQISGFMRRIMVHGYGTNFGPRTMRLKETPFQDVILCGQHNFEAKMAEGLKQWGTSIEFETEVTALAQDHDGVTATILSKGETSTFLCDYVIGCDGANGVTRTFTKLDFVPKKTGVGLRQVDCKLVWKRLSTTEQMWLFYFDQGFAVIVPLPGGIHRVITVEPKANMPEREPTLAEMQERIRLIVSDDSVTLTDLEWASYSDLSMGIADGLRDGRIILAGDVGNPILPNGGQGMNTGISDAFNLGWKLASIFRGCSESLLDTYDKERHLLRSKLEQAQFNSLKYTTLVTPAWMRALMTIFGEFALNHGGEYAMAQAFSQLTINTKDSLLTLESSRNKGIRAGDRVQDADVVRGTESIKLFDILYSGGWNFLAFSGTKSSIRGDLKIAVSRLEEIGQSVYVVSTNSKHTFKNILFDLDQVAHRVYGVSEPVIYLIRPDGYVGARVSLANLESLLSYAKKWLPKQALKFSDIHLTSV